MAAVSTAHACSSFGERDIEKYGGLPIASQLVTMQEHAFHQGHGMSGGLGQLCLNRRIAVVIIR